MTETEVDASSRSLARLRNLAGAAVDGLAAAPVRSLVCVLTVASPIFWILSGLAISEGLRREATGAVARGPDLVVAGDRFGVDATLETHRIPPMAELPGIASVTPRIVGRVAVSEEWVVVVALGDALGPKPADVPKPSPGELWVGRELAERLGWSAGKTVLLEARRSLTLQVGATFSTGSWIGSRHAIQLAHDDAVELFEQPELASDVLVDCRPGYEQRVADLLARDPALRVQSRPLVRDYLSRAYTIRAGSLMLLFAFALAIGVPLFLLLADLGATPRRREIAVLRVCGWSTLDVLTLNLIENVLIGLAGAALAFLLAWFWVEGLGAPLLRSYFLPESGGSPLRIPAVWSSLPLLVATLLALLLTTSAGVLSVWRSSVVSPGEALRR